MSRVAIGATRPAMCLRTNAAMASIANVPSRRAAKVPVAKSRNATTKRPTTAFPASELMNSLSASMTTSLHEDAQRVQPHGLEEQGLRCPCLDVSVRPEAGAGPELERHAASPRDQPARRETRAFLRH